MIPQKWILDLKYPHLQVFEITIYYTAKGLGINISPGTDLHVGVFELK